MNKRAFLAAACLAFLTAAAREGLPSRFDERRDAAADVVYALTLANAEGKRVIVDVGGEWCPWCHVLDRFIARHDDVRALLDAKYIWVKVNYSPKNKNELLLSRWPKVTAYPHLFVLDASGALLHSQSSSEMEASKDYDKNKMLAFLERFAS